MSRKFSRRNYHEALDKLVPQIYTDEDIKLASEKDDLPSKILDADADLVLKFLDINGLLYQFGTGPIRGFAVTLSIGILASMFTAIVVTRVIFNYITNRFTIKELSI